MFAQLDADLTPDKVAQTAYAMGITTHLDWLPAEAIGGLRTASLRWRWPTPTRLWPTVALTYRRRSSTGRVPRRQRASTSAIRQTVFTDGEAYAATQMIKGVITSGTGTAADYGCPAAGKTGTSSYLPTPGSSATHPDATAVWVGYPQGNIPMARLRRHAGGADLARLHADGVERLLR